MGDIHKKYHFELETTLLLSCDEPFVNHEITIVELVINLSISPLRLCLVLHTKNCLSHLLINKMHGCNLHKRIFVNTQQSVLPNEIEVSPTF